MNTKVRKPNIKQIYAKNKKRRGRSKYLMSWNVMVGKKNPVPAKSYMSEQRGKSKDRPCIRVHKSLNFSEEEIILDLRKTLAGGSILQNLKSTLNLIGECRSSSLMIPDCLMLP